MTDIKKLEKVEDVMPGDIIIYRADVRDGGEIEHSGVVVEVRKGLFITPWILSKLGEGHEMVHPYTDCPYNLSNIGYYRVVPCR